MGGISRWRNRRRAFLLMFGLIYVLIGYGYISQPIPNVQSTAQSVAFGLAPIWAWGICWAACGAIMAVAALRRWTESRGGDWGFGLGAFMPALWGVLSLVTWTTEASPRAWITALIFGAVSASVIVISGMVDPRFTGQR